ncbi:malonyl-CoA decarboxylase domain-containing protein [Flavobacterium sp. N1994]|uniref:malonyl-CoA decarboxylase domain-containing protein n=1 Tax=Flavobacterium sp. N1994 TaxID=2986827 RepID=UPI0022220DE1|nr:malonyl-CoA decarboxylase family protein [Flavobacterium sp. N1994]
MILQHGQEGFDNHWLELVKYDPVHPLIPFEKRITGNRTIFVFTDNNIPQFMVCARIGNKLTHNMKDVLSDDGYSSKFDVTYAIFYSIFRLPNATLKGAGKMAITEILEICRKKEVNRFFTLSPIPSLKNSFKEIPNESQIRAYLESFEGPVSKFHLSNGAKIQSVNFNADSSEIRLNESWGIMVNYDYNFL